MHLGRRKNAEQGRSTDIEALDESPRNMKDVQIDEKAECVVFVSFSPGN